MRPVRLQAQGFGAFREPVDVDFEDVDLFALVGATGSGKSTIIDAMCFALYGAVPRYEHRSLVAPVITTGASVARVSFTFAAGPRRYVATRVVRRTASGNASTKEASLERLSDADSDVLARNADELSTQVEELLGLSFDHFTRCVVLPQGAFARFLHDKPAARQDLLIRLLDFGVYERMRMAAQQRSAVASNRVELARQRLDQLGPHTSTSRIDAQKRREALESLRSDLAGAVAGIETTQAAAAEATSRAKEIAALVTALARVNIPAAVTEQREIIEKAESALEAARAEEESTNDDLGSAEQALQALPPLEELIDVSRAHEKLKACAIDLEKATAEGVEAERVARESEKETQAAEEAVVVARDRLETVRRELAAEHLAEQLTVGAPCPVCRQDVTELPDHMAHSSLEETQSALGEAEREAIKARKAHTATLSTLSALRERAEDLGRRKSELEALTVGYPDQEQLEKVLATAREAVTTVERARKAQSEARKATAAADNTMQAAKRKLQSQQSAFHGQRDGVAALDPPAPKGSDLAHDWRELTIWAAEQLPVQRELEEAARQRSAEFTARAEAELERFTEGADALDVPTAASMSTGDLRDAVTASATKAAGLVESIDKALEEKAALEADITNATETQQVASELTKLLSANHFERWLVAEALHTLVAGASETLRSLSGGAYSLTCTDGGDFMVVDHHNADETRPVRTLSGGETFQASLALALALADHLVNLAAQGATRLESMFLDEGFGTLDPDTLTTVADTIESLGSDRRMVGVVTHVRELAERIPVRYVVTKDARTARVERVST